MILHDPKSTISFKPDENLGSNVTYFLRTPTVVDRVKYRHAVAAEGGRNWSQLQMLEALEEGLRRILSEPEDKERLDNYVQEVRSYREMISAVIDEYRQESLEIKGHENEGDQVELIRILVDRLNPPQIIVDIEQVVIDHYPPYAAKLADQSVYHEYAGLVAARMFLVGWEGLEEEFKRQRNGVPDHVLSYIPTAHLIAIGGEVQRLMEPGVSRLKNFQSRSGGRGDPDRSNGTETPPETDPSQTTTGSAQNSESMNSESIH